MHVDEQRATEPRMARRARIRARLRRHRAFGVSLALLTGIGVVFGTMGSASADPSAGEWAALRNCESGGNYAINTGNGYYGAYQFDIGTWRSVGGSGLPSDASPATQDALAYKLWQQRGWSPWACASILGLPEGGSGGPAVPPPAPKPAPVVKPMPPVGSFDQLSVNASRTALRIVGWAVDRNSSASSISVRITVNGAGFTRTANVARTDVDRVLGVSGSHGFSVPLATHAGTYKVCITALGRTSGNNTSLGCRTTVIQSFARGSLAPVPVQGGQAVVSGWAYDPNNASWSNRVHVYVNGVGHALTAAGPRGDVNAAFGISGNHGFRVGLPLRPGSNTICAHSIGFNSSNTVSLGCRTVGLPAPVGSLAAPTVSAGKAVVNGWAYDPNAPTKSISVHVYINGVGYSVPTNVVRTDVNASRHITGTHGFKLVAPLRVGSNSVCAHAIGVQAGNNRLLACTTVRR